MSEAIELVLQGAGLADPHGELSGSRKLGYVLFQTVQLADAGLSTQVRSTLFEDLIFGQVSK